MAHYAKIGADDVVQQVVVFDSSWEVDGEDACIARIVAWGALPLADGEYWKKTSYSASMRKNFAAVDGTYSAELDAFIPPKPFPEAVLDEDTCQWKNP